MALQIVVLGSPGRRRWRTCGRAASAASRSSPAAMSSATSSTIAGRVRLAAGHLDHPQQVAALDHDVHAAVVVALQHLDHRRGAAQLARAVVVGEQQQEGVTRSRASLRSAACSAPRRCGAGAARPAQDRCRARRCRSRECPSGGWYSIQPMGAPRERDAIAGLVPYEPGRPAADVRRELGDRPVVKLASNEGQLGPFPAALEAIAAHAAGLNRYPELGVELREAVAARHGVARRPRRAGQRRRRAGRLPVDRVPRRRRRGRAVLAVVRVLPGGRGQDGRGLARRRSAARATTSTRCRARSARARGSPTSATPTTRPAASSAATALAAFSRPCLSASWWSSTRRTTSTSRTRLPGRGRRARRARQRVRAAHLLEDVRPRRPAGRIRDRRAVGGDRDRQGAAGRSTSTSSPRSRRLPASATRPRSSAAAGANTRGP